MQVSGKYIYAVFAQSREVNRKLNQIDWQLSKNKGWWRKFFSGKKNEDKSKRPYVQAEDKLSVISYQDVSALIADSVIVDYSKLGKQALAQALVKHQKVIEEVMEAGITVVPMKLGTFVEGNWEVEQILKKGYSLIQEILTGIDGKIEINVTASWSDFDSVIKQVGQAPEVKQLKEDILANPQGVTSDAQLKAGLMVKKLLEREGKNCKDYIQETLSPFSYKNKFHECMNDKMVTNCAFLVDRGQQKEFDQRIRTIDEKFKGELNFRCVGPLPAYSFYTLEIKKMQYEDLDWARKKLDLDELVSREEIEKAYKNKSLLTHPDRNPDTPGKNEKFDKVNKAYNIVSDYCQSLGQAFDGKKASFKEKEFRRNSILVRMKK